MAEIFFMQIWNKRDFIIPSLFFFFFCHSFFSLFPHKFSHSTISWMKNLTWYFFTFVNPWVVYGPENGYNFPHPRLLKVKASCSPLSHAGRFYFISFYYISLLLIFLFLMQIWSKRDFVIPSLFFFFFSFPFFPTNFSRSCTVFWMKDLT